MSIDDLEPVFEADEIQGNILGGFNKPHQAVLPLCFDEHAAAISGAREWMRTLLSDVTYLPQVAQFRLALAEQTAKAGSKPNGMRAVWTNIAFSHQGIQKLADSSDEFEPVFKKGLAESSAAIGDPVDPASPGNAGNWIFGGPNAVPDMLLIIAGDQADDVHERTRIVLELAASKNIRCPHYDVGHDLSKFPDVDFPSGREHFGFKDGISQPGVRGRVSANPDVFITHRQLPLDLDPAPSDPAFSAPGQPLIFPGEFVLGYPRQSDTFGRRSRSPWPLGRDETNITTQPMGPTWAKNGSYLVYRRLRQNVPAFNRFLERQLQTLRELPGFADLTREKLGAMLVGRWPSGAPLLRTVQADDPKLGSADGPNNNFNYATRETSNDWFAAAIADPEGRVCPGAAHIRKVNPRRLGTDQGGPNATLARRILRRGIPYGAPLRIGATNDPFNTDRGLLFLSYQASIREQFQFLQTSWTNSDSKPTPQLANHAGFDMIMGQNPIDSRARFCLLGGGTRISTTPQLDPEWVIPTAGGYFFSPSRTALRDLFAHAAEA